MANEDGVDVPIMKPQCSEANVDGKQGVGEAKIRVGVLLAKLMEVKACIKGSEDDTKKELDVLRKRVKTTTTLLAYLKSKARVAASPNLALASCGIKQLEGVGLVDKNGTPLSGWSRSMDLSSFDSPSDGTWIGINSHQGCIDEQDGEFIGEVYKPVQMISDVMETLVKRVIAADSKAAFEREK